MSDVPLIYTSKGNLPLESLKVSVEWQETDDYIACIETYKDSTGEVVKQSPHIRLKRGVGIEPALGSIG